jgi:hypothetical protein
LVPGKAKTPEKPEFTFGVNEDCEDIFNAAAGQKINF